MACRGLGVQKLMGLGFRVLGLGLWVWSLGLFLACAAGF